MTGMFWRRARHRASSRIDSPKSRVGQRSGSSTSSPHPRLSLLIPTRSLGRLSAVLTSLAAQDSAGVSYETIVVVNGGGHELSEAVAAMAPGVRVVKSSVNRGVAGGYNLGRSVATGELIVLMHDDIELEPGWLQAWIHAADRHPEAGVIGCKVLYPDGTMRGAGSILWSDAHTSPPWIGEGPTPDAFVTPRTVDYSSSCSLLIRSQTWDDCGGLNEDFYPAYYVDVDIAMSARNLGWSVLYWPQACVRHDGGSPGRARWRGFVAARNRDRFIARWSSHLSFHHPNDGDVEGAIALAAQWRAVDSSSEEAASGPPRLAPRSLVSHSDEYYRTIELELQADYIRFLESALDSSG
jgi:GT2 family glycosyltransferase